MKTKKGLIYRIAKSIIDRDERKQQTIKKKEDHEREKRELRNEAFKTFFKEYIKTKVEEFKSFKKPEFEIGEKVIVNWFGSHDTWESNMPSLMSHTPYKGPIEVKILDVSICSMLLEDRLNNFYDKGVFDRWDWAINESLYSDLTKFVDGRISAFIYPSISYVYKIKVPKDDKVYWNYSIRENKFLKKDSEAAIASIEAWKKYMEMSEESKKYNYLKTQFSSLEEIALNKIMDLEK